MSKISELSPISERLIQWIDSKKVSVSKFESLTGIGNGYVKKIKKKMGYDQIEKIKKVYPDFPEEWIKNGNNDTITPPNVSGIINNGFVGSSITQNNGSTAHENEEDDKDYKKLYFGSLKTINALLKVINGMAKNACGENIPIEDLDKLDFTV